MKKLLSFLVIVLLCFSTFATNFTNVTAYMNSKLSKSDSLTLNQPADSLSLSTYDNFGVYVQRMLEDVTEATAYQYDANDSQSLWLQTIKIVKNPINGYLGIYHTPMDDETFVVRLANSTDLLNWEFIRNVTYDASQPTIAQAPNCAYIVALEKKEPDCKSHLQFQYYSNLPTLLNDSPNATLDTPRTLSNSNEGTPNIYNITIESSLMKACVGFHFLNNTIGLDRVAAGWLTIPLDNPENMIWENVTELFDYNEKLVSMGVQGNIGDRDHVQLLGRNYTLQEAQLRKDDWSSWRIFLYDHSKNNFTMLNIKTHKGSVSFSNPTCTILRFPNNESCFVTTYFIHTNGSANGEAGQLIFYKEFVVVPDDYPTIQEAINRANSGNNIYVKSGEYKENIVINKAISLIAESADVTKIDGVFETAVKIIANNVVVANFSINSNGGNGIDIEHSVNNTIIYNKINANVGVGLLLRDSSNNTIMQNQINSNTYVSVWVGLYSSYNMFAENEINVNLGDGIWLFGSNNTFSGDDLLVNIGVGIYLGPYSFDNILNFNSITVNNGKAVDYELTAPVTTCDYDGLWHTDAFTIDLTTSDDKSGIFEIYYRINSGPIQNMSTYGQPFTTTEGANNTLEYWSVDNAGNEELPHEILTGIKLDKTVPTIGIPFRIPEDDVEPGQEVKVLANVADSLSGVKYVTLSYNLNDSAVWIVLPMTFNSTTGLYETAIQVQQAHTLVRYKITAYDNAGNLKVEDNNGYYYVYTVIPEFPSTMSLPLLMLTTLIATVLHKKKRKNKKEGNKGLWN